MCASAHSDQSSMTERILEKILEKIDPVDIIILSTGFWLGLRGWTPITALINYFTGLKLDSLGVEYKTYVETNGQKQKLPLPVRQPGLIDEIMKLFGVKDPTAFDFDKKQTIPTSPSETKFEQEEIIMKGMIGMLEAYAITRPGFLTGIGEIIPL